MLKLSEEIRHFKNIRRNWFEIIGLRIFCLLGWEFFEIDFFVIKGWDSFKDYEEVKWIWFFINWKILLNDFFMNLKINKKKII